MLLRKCKAKKNCQVRPQKDSQHKLTPREYKARFDGVTKRDNETFVLFSARLCNNLRYYLRSREVVKILIDFLTCWSPTN